MTRMHEQGRQMLALLILIITLIAAACPVLAETDIPAEEVSPYRIILTAPGGWTNSNSAVIKVSVTDINGLGWYKIEYRMNDGSWIDCEDLFDHGKAEITVRENGTFTLRMTDPHGHQFEESAVVSTIDVSAPTVTASVNGMTLYVNAADDLSGIAGVQINSMLFTSIVNGSLSVELDSSMNRFDKLAIRAFDFAGNFSQPISLDNPNYVEPAEPTAEPTATVKPTKKPDTGTEQGAVPGVTQAPVTAVPQQPTVTAGIQHGLGSSLIYVQDYEVYTPTDAPAVAPTAAPTPEPIIQTEYITIGPGMPYQADGNSHTLDVLYSAATNKQFITLQSKNGNTFYLVIDYDKPIDEAAEMYETYFLNLVDERDLLALMSDEEKEQVPTPEPEIIYVTPEPTSVPSSTEAPAGLTPDPSKKSDQSTALIALIAIVALLAVGAFFLIRNKGKGTRPRSDNDFELEDEDEAEETDQNEN